MAILLNLVKSCYADMPTLWTDDLGAPWSSGPCGPDPNGPVVDPLPAGIHRKAPDRRTDKQTGRRMDGQIYDERERERERER